AMAAIVIISAAAFAGWRLRAPTPPAVVRFTMALPANETLQASAGGLAIAPNGSLVAFTAVGPDQVRRIFLRRLDQAEAVQVPGSAGARFLFFSPDSQWIAFSTANGLQRAPVSGGTPISICQSCSSAHGAWGDDGMIYFTQGGKMQRVAASGGTPTAMTAQQDPHHAEALPGGRGLVYSFGSMAKSGDDDGIALQPLKAGKGTVLMQGGTDPQYLAGGYLVYAQGGRLLAAPFDLGRQELSGAAFPVVEDVWQGTGGYAAYAIARDGTLAYVNGGKTGGKESPSGVTAEWVDRAGVGHPVSAGAFEDPQLSPDGKRVALTVRNGVGADVWTLDLAHGTLTRLTFAKPNERDEHAVWTPDGKKLVYETFRGGAYTLAARAADGSGTEQELFASPLPVAPQSISPDGKTLLFYWVQQNHPVLWQLPLTGGGKPTRVIQGDYPTFAAQLSPDGRWLAYCSDEDGPDQVFVRPYPSLDGKWQISVHGGGQPRWSPDGRQLFYRVGDQMLAVSVAAAGDRGAGFSFGAPRLL